jgi:hypothetical protein
MSCVEVFPNACECAEMFLEGKCVHTIGRDLQKMSFKRFINIPILNILS